MNTMGDTTINRWMQGHIDLPVPPPINRAARSRDTLKGAVTFIAAAIWIYVIIAALLH